MTANQAAPRGFVEGIDRQQPARVVYGGAEGALRFEECDQPPEAFHEPPPQPLAVAANPFVVARRKQIAAIQAAGVLECLPIARQPAVERLFELDDVEDRTQAQVPRDGPAAAVERGAYGRRGLAQVMELASEIRQRLGVACVGPQLPRYLRPRHRPVAMEREVREKVLLPRRHGVRQRAISGDDAETSEKLETK
jgi:hypothetical protein